MNCPNCEVRYEEKPQLLETENDSGYKLFKCPKCEKVFELNEVDD